MIPRICHSESEEFFEKASMMLMASPSNKTNLPPIFRAVEIAKRAVWASPQAGSPAGRDFEQA